MAQGNKTTLHRHRCKGLRRVVGQTPEFGVCFDQASPLSLKEAGSSFSSAVANDLVREKWRNHQHLYPTNYPVCLPSAPVRSCLQSAASAPRIRPSWQPPPGQGNDDVADEW